MLAARFTSDRQFAQQAWLFLRGLVDGRLDSLDCVVYGGILLGIVCGVLGAFVVLRRQSLLGDAIGHAVLPGVCVGFLIAQSRSMPMLLSGAVVFGLLAAMLISLLQRTTKLKSPECMGVVFSGFYGLGIVLLKIISRGSTAGKSGLEKFLWGQIVGLTPDDLILIGIIVALSIILIRIYWRPLALSSFDPSYAASQGIAVQRIHYLLSAMLTVAIVISIQAVGVILVSAMLIIPAATAYLLTDRLKRMVILSGALGALAGLMGAFFSYTLKGAPTGSLMVLAATVPFMLTICFAPRHGVLPRLLRVIRHRKLTHGQNLLRSIYMILERRNNGFEDRRIGVDDIAAIRQETPQFIAKLVRIAAKQNWVRSDSPDPVILTDAGLDEAKRLTRNHRLWELFLTHEAKLSSQAVHTDAEQIEHVLAPDVLQRLEAMLDHPQTDPHGSIIPTSTETGSGER